MSWCDKLASTPGMGVRLSPLFTSGDSIIDGLSDVLRPLIEGKLDEPAFNVEQVTPFGLTIATNEGYRYQIDHSKVSVVFHHRMRAKPVSGGLPVMHMLSSPAPFSQVLPTVADKLAEAVLSLPRITERTLIRVGVLSTTNVARDDVPPGIDRFIKYVGRPWPDGTDDLSLNIFGRVKDTDHWSDRCSHQLQMSEDKEKLLVVAFDYQRMFKNPPKVNEDRLRQLFRQCREDAVEYFERVAEGNMFDEQLISGASDGR